MEVFLWSASGQILLDTLASSYPTVLAYLVDTPRSSSPATFMSNMLYACSVLYKSSLPMILVANKTDVKGGEFVREWMTDFEAFQAAVRAEKSSDGEEGMGYMGSLMGSMGLVLEEFYHQLDVPPPRYWGNIDGGGIVCVRDRDG
jgi:GPN-loop GTPase